MKTSKNIKPAVKRLSFLAILLLSSFTISANPLNYILGADATGLDVVYILSGISAISLLLFYPDNAVANHNIQQHIKIKSSTLSLENYHRKVVKKTS